MSRESDNGFVCGDCGETVYRDLCACDNGADLLAKQIGDSFFEATLENYQRTAERLRASNDTRVIKAHNENVKMFMEKIGGHI